MNGEMLFQEGFNCGQAVFAPHAVALGMDEEQALACLVLGLHYGHTTVDDKAGKERTYGLVRSFHEEFTAVHGTTRCGDLLGVDLRVAEGQKTFRENQLDKTVCLKCVATADALIRKILKENP